MRYGVQTYRKKPVAVTALQWTGANFADMERFLGSPKAGGFDDKGVLYIHTFEGTMRAMPGDYIICGVAGEFYPCKPVIFEATYEHVPEPEPQPLTVMHHPV